MTTITVYTSADGAVRGFLASGHAGGKKIRGYEGDTRCRRAGRISPVRVAAGD